MIVVRSPLRISFVGGGSDLPAYCDHEIGMVVSAAIQHSVYVMVAPRHDGRIRVSYSEHEEVSEVDHIRHDIVRESLKKFNIRGGIEIVSMADLSSGAGLGSSGAFTVGLMHALCVFQGSSAFLSGDLYCSASDVEIWRCKKPVGYQDQAASAYGGLKKYEFHVNGGLHIEDLWWLPQREELEKRLLLVDMGSRKPSADILDRQSSAIYGGSSQARATVRSMANLASAFTDHFTDGDVNKCGHVVDAAWSLKKSIDPEMTNDLIDTVYAFAKDRGALGGKICGAGGRGMLLLICSPYARETVQSEITHRFSLNTIIPRLSQSGVQVVWSAR